MAAKQTKVVRFGGHLKDVIEEYDHGIHDNYNIVLQQIGDAKIKSSQLCEILKQFVEVANLLGKNHKVMVNKLLQIGWAMREREIIELFHEFLADLVTGNPIHLTHILSSLVVHFQPASVLHGGAELCVTEAEIYQIVHQTIQRIFTLIPLSNGVIFQLLVLNFPFVKKGVKITEWYIKNLLFLTTYHPSLRHEILELIVSKIVELDTLSPRDKIKEHSPPDDEMFEMEVPTKKGDEIYIEKLEVCMETLFQYICDVCGADNGTGAQSKSLYDELLAIFDGVLLPVHGCSHIQFLMFYICSLNTNFHENFIAHLWKKVEQPSTPVILRQTSMCYVASFLARAKFVRLETSMAALEEITMWIRRYIAEREDDNCTNYVHEVFRHGTFYSVCQGLFYILIFKLKDILDKKKGFRFLQKLHLEHIIMSRLNPLKYCISTVVNLFSSMMRIHQVVYCDSIIERNNRHSIPMHGHTDSANHSNPLDSFFPFDPYLLKSSSSFVSDIYQEWEGRVPQPGDDSKDDVDDADLMGTSPIAVPNVLEHEQIFRNSFGGKSMSPGFALVGSSQF